jgi:cytochrome c553
MDWKRSTLVGLALCWLWGSGCGDHEPIVLNDQDATDGADQSDTNNDQGGDPADANNGGSSEDMGDAPDGEEGDVPSSDAGPDSTFTGQLPGNRVVQAGQFTTSAACAECHSASPNAEALRDSFNDTVAPYDLWSATMMGLSSRDPFWRAMVSAEKASTPEKADFIEQICIHCHAPLGDLHARSNGYQITSSTLDSDTELGQLSLDGISCTLCHQMTDENFGQPESFTGGFVLNDERLIYGPYDDPLAEPMQEALDYQPTQGEHMKEGALCGTCHTVYTPSLSPEGDFLNIQFPEQVTYLEWRNSSYNTGPNAGPKARPCVDCHMPTTDAIGSNITTAIARQPDGTDFPNLPERGSVRRHVWFGGNTTMLKMMRAAREDLAPHVPAQAFDRVLAATEDHLTSRTARVEVVNSTCAGQECSVRVRVTHDAGHKFPTGFPSRRAWLRVRVFDANDDVLFSSGEYDAQGRILGADGGVLLTEQAGRAIQPHHITISSQDQVQIYESVMGSQENQYTSVLMRAARYLKDNRLLPEGYNQNHADIESMRSVGVEQDPDFINRQDTVEYQITLPAGATPARAQATLLFQSLGARYMDEVFQIDTPEIAYFQELYQSTDTRPFAVSADEVNILR